LPHLEFRGCLFLILAIGVREEQSAETHDLVLFIHHFNIKEKNKKKHYGLGVYTSSILQYLYICVLCSSFCVLSHASFIILFLHHLYLHGKNGFLELYFPEHQSAKFLTLVLLIHHFIKKRTMIMGSMPPEYFVAPEHLCHFVIFNFRDSWCTLAFLIFSFYPHIIHICMVRIVQLHFVMKIS